MASQDGRNNRSDVVGQRLLEPEWPIDTERPLWLSLTIISSRAAPFLLPLSTNTLLWKPSNSKPFASTADINDPLYLRMGMFTSRKGTATSQGRNPTRRSSTFWRRAQKTEIIRERVPAYRLSEDALRDYLTRRFPGREFKIQVSTLRLISAVDPE